MSPGERVEVAGTKFTEHQCYLAALQCDLGSSAAWIELVYGMNTPGDMTAIENDEWGTGPRENLGERGARLKVRFGVRCTSPLRLECIPGTSPLPSKVVVP